MESQNLKVFPKKCPTKNNEPCNMKGLKENGGLVNERRHLEMNGLGIKV
jgi:hypothetical protein